MYCPKCKSEYRPGFSRCYDCDIDLVDKLFVDDETQWPRVWNGDSQADCVDACKELRKANIAYRVSQTPTGLARGMAVDFRYEISVSQADYFRASAMLKPEGDKADDSLDTPAVDAPLTQPSSDRPDGTESQGSSDEIEIFSQAPRDHSSIVELSMTTNFIYLRAQVEEDGTLKIFVAPEDESLAREIVREIQEGASTE